MKTKDEIQHYGNRNSGRYPRGSGKHPDKVFVSGTSKLHSKEDGYYRKTLPKEIAGHLDKLISKGSTILVGDCVGVDSAVQKHLFDKQYKNVEIYVSGDTVRNNADSDHKLGWKIHHVDASKYQEGSKEWHAEKDKLMSSHATSGLAVILDSGSSATRKNIDRLLNDNKNVDVYQLNADGKDHWKDITEYSEENKQVKHGDESIYDEVREIQHYGNRNSGRYPRGSGKHPKNRSAISRIINEYAQKQQISREAMRQSTKQARTLLKIRKNNDKIIREGLKKLSKMTPEEAAAFTDKMKRFNTIDMLTEEHMRSIAETKISQVKVYTAKMEFLDKGLGTLKTGMSIAEKVFKNPDIKNLSEALGRNSKTAKSKILTVKNSPQSIDEYTNKYMKLTGADEERAKREVTNIVAAASHNERINKMFNKAVKEELKKKKEGE